MWKLSHGQHAHHCTSIAHASSAPTPSCNLTDTHAQHAQARLAGLALEVQALQGRADALLTWHIRQEKVAQTGSLVSAMQARRQQIRDQQRPCQSAPPTPQSRREPRSGLSLLSRPAHLLHAANCLHARAPHLPSAWPWTPCARLPYQPPCPRPTRSTPSASAFSTCCPIALLSFCDP